MLKKCLYWLKWLFTPTGKESVEQIWYYMYEAHRLTALAMVLTIINLIFLIIRLL